MRLLSLPSSNGSDLTASNLHDPRLAASVVKESFSHGGTASRTEGKLSISSGSPQLLIITVLNVSEFL